MRGGGGCIWVRPGVDAWLRQNGANPRRPREGIAGASGDAFALVEGGQEGASSRGARVTGSAVRVDGALAHLTPGRPPGRVEQAPVVDAARSVVQACLL